MKKQNSNKVSKSIPKKNKKLLSVLTVCAFAFTLFAGFVPHSAFAAGSTDWSNFGVKPSSNLNTSGIYTDLNTVIGIIIGLGGFWIICCLIFAGIKLASAQGGNPQARTAGFVGIGMAFIGGWVIMKAHTIAAFIAGFGN